MALAPFLFGIVLEYSVSVKDLFVVNMKGTNMAVKPTVALRAMLVGGIAVFAKVAGAMKAAGGVKLGAAATAMSMAAAAMTQSKDDPKSPSK
ncbi:hypothetical protein EZV62_003488 [Acer yangbiense]|uniref:Uncharacterized protein n=1 Tax=Acer yangbiense TaxID=1000413 RepID=A0A5C7IH07_9ROSI|nr:hypothetical protein EZV62_003488 [Acer yangbiense]